MSMTPMETPIHDCTSWKWTRIYSFMTWLHLKAFNVVYFLHSAEEFGSGVSPLSSQSPNFVNISTIYLFCFSFKFIDILSQKDHNLAGGKHLRAVLKALIVFPMSVTLLYRGQLLSARRRLHLSKCLSPVCRWCHQSEPLQGSCHQMSAAVIKCQQLSSNVSS